MCAIMRLFFFNREIVAASLWATRTLPTRLRWASAWRAGKRLQVNTARDKVERVVPNALAWARVIASGTSRSNMIFLISDI
jgi:hypothetical protein